MRKHKKETLVLCARRKWETPLSLGSLEECYRRYSSAEGIDLQAVGKACLATVFGIQS